MHKLLRDCTKDGKFHPVTCWGIQHAIITAVVTLIASQVYAPATIVVGLAAVAVFIVLELRGQGGLFAHADRIGDWVFPLIVAILITYYLGDNSWLVER